MVEKEITNQEVKMAGTKKGGKRAAKTNLKNHGKDFYRIIGSKGGSVKGIKKGFAAHPELAKIYGAKGGRNGKRGTADEAALNRLQKEIKKLKQPWRHSLYAKKGEE